MASYVSEAVIKRLPGYYRHLRELESAGVTQISSQELGRRMQLTASQIRQDITCLGGFGRQGYGYKVSELKGHIGEILGLTNKHNMIIIGAGNIGCAVANYPTFSGEGFITKAIFDSDPNKVGTLINGMAVKPVDELDAFLEENVIDIAVIAVPAACAQWAMDKVTAKGVGAIWNFAPTDIRPPRGVVSVNVHLSDTLQILSYKMLHREDI